MKEHCYIKIKDNSLSQKKAKIGEILPAIRDTTHYADLKYNYSWVAWQVEMVSKPEEPRKKRRTAIQIAIDNIVSTSNSVSTP